MMSQVAALFRAEIFVFCRIGALIGRYYGSFRSMLGEKVRASSVRRRFIALAVASMLIAGLLLLHLSSGEQPDGKCPAPKQKQSVRGGPSSLLMYSGQLAHGPGRNAIVGQCARWESTTQTSLPLEEVRARIECLSILINENGKAGGNPSDMASFRQRSRAAVGAVHGVRMALDTLQTKLSSLRGDVTKTRKPSDVLIALGGLAGLEQQSREALAILQLTVDIFQRHRETISRADQALLVEAIELRTKVIRSLLTSVRTSRMIARELPAISTAVQHVQLCKPRLLADLEQFAIDAVVPGSETESSGAMFDAGHLISEVGMAINQVPLFGAPATATWSADAKGIPMIANIVLSEKMLLVGFEGNKHERATSYISRLLQHAQFLSTRKMHEAAVWRYHVAADLANKQGLHELASNSLAQLSYMLSVNGEHEDALNAANDAMRYGTDALASYLQVSLRLSLGELRTDADVHAAKEQLKVIAGKLTAEHLEEKRAAILAHLGEWGGIDEMGTLSSCLGFGDVAQLLVCVLGRLAYA